MRRRAFISITLLFPLLIVSQIRNGIVQYKVTNNSNFDNEKTKYLYSNEVKKVTTELTLELKFDDTESSFNAVKPINCSTENFESALISSDIKGFYSLKNDNLSLDWYKEDKEMGDVIIQYENNLNWDLKNETKVIDGYECYKATCNVTNYNYIYTPNSEITAWYCPNVPVKLGPKRYNGLPGLIFEITDRHVTLSITKINLNLKDKIEFTPPYKGNKISQLEYKQMIEDYIDDMMNE